MIIIHDFFSQNGGGENLVLSIAKELNIKIITAYNNKKKNFLIKTSKFQFLISINIFFVFLYYKFFFKINEKESIVFSGNHCCFSIKRCKAKKKILYAHSLPKTLFSSLYLDYKDSLALNLFQKYLIKEYRNNINSLDYIIFNSEKTKLKFLHVFPDLDKNVITDVIYPFSDLEFKSQTYKNNSKNKYFVINSRHQSYKNLKHIILLLIPFLKTNKEIKIYITHEGDQTKDLIPSSNFSNQIFFTGFLDFRDYQNLLINSTGIIFPSRDEDFGIAALDAYNLNIPVIVQKNCGFSEILPENYLYFYNDMNLIKIINKLIENNNMNKILYENKVNYKDVFLKKFIEMGSV